MSAPHYVYRTFDSYGLLLYVGCTNNPTQRLATHCGQAPWFRFAETIAVAGPWDRREALDRERTAIETEGTYFNSSFAYISLTQANRIAARKVLRARGCYYPDLDLHWYDAGDVAYVEQVEIESAAWDRARARESARLKESTHPYMTNADRLGRYLAARGDAESARVEMAGAA